MFIFIPIMVEIIFVVTFLSVFVRIIKNAKLNKNQQNRSSNSETFKNTILNANDESSYANSISSEPLEVYCAYCGSKYNKNKKRCPSCGAKIQK